MAMDKTFNSADIEQELYKEWEEGGYFAKGQKPNAETYTIMMPPPNVTGSLHIGHALTFSIQDMLVRFQRLLGKDVLWQPGMDHAGIATQIIVEKKLAEKGMKRHDFSREEFIEKVWEWKDESGGMIQRQLRRLGASPDWSRDRFTMDEGLSKAVRKAFVQMFKDDLIYRDKRLVNWDPVLHTSVSDLEVISKERKGHLWHFKYPVEGQEGTYITVATTRPETMLGDSGVAVHPSDERYKDLIGKNVVLPLVGRRIPIVADEHADPETGSGAVKITPAHDFNDFEVGKRNNLEMINIFDENAALNENVPEKYRGIDRDKAREIIIADMESQGLLEKVEDHISQVPYGERSGIVVEPWLTDQWFVNAEVLAKPAIEAVEKGETKFVPKNWEKTYYQWMRNIQPWCISRQLWWGHRIPVWYGPDGKTFCEETDEAVYEAARAHYGKDVDLTQDEDVLDTWYSSGLWAFSTLGWPEQTPELERYYPTDVLVTGFDIIFFWVARMMMMSLYFMKDENGKGVVPFKDVYMHALVRDEKGQKMSKSKGNVMDPLDLCDKFGADAVRFTLAAMAAQGRDIALGESRVEGYRNFATKLWNAARFCEMNECRPVDGFNPADVKQTVNRWVIDELMKTADAAYKGFEEYRFNEAADALYHFTYGTFCDWYIEFTKPIFSGEDEGLKEEVRATTAWVLSKLLTMLSPMMPFITEEIARHLHDDKSLTLMKADWPCFDGVSTQADAAKEMNWVIDFITAIRSIRSDMNLPAGKKLPLVLKADVDNVREWTSPHQDLIKKLARLEQLELSDNLPDGSARGVIDGGSFAIPLGGVIDIAAEKERLSKEIGKVEKEIASLAGRLANENFIAKAPEAVVNEQRDRLKDYEATKEKLRQAYQTITEV